MNHPAPTPDFEEREAGGPSSHEEPSARGTFAGEARFLVALLGLLGVLLVEFFYNLLRLLFFLPRRKIHRDRVRRIIFHGGAPGPLYILLLGVALLAGGCAQPNATLPPSIPPRGEAAEEIGGPGSFRRQLRELGWSVRTLADQSDARRSFKEDMETFPILREPWRKNLLFDVRYLFTMEDARKSLEFDLMALASPDHRGQGVLETLRMWGW